MTFLKPAVLTMAALAAVASLATDAQAQRAEYRADLRSNQLERFASGTAKFELRPDRIKFSAEVEDLAVTNEIFVFVQGVFVGSQAVDPFGFADLDLDSRLGDVVPMMEVGDRVDIYDENGNLILMGILTLRRER
jgi:hypothetical protein